MADLCNKVDLEWLKANVDQLWAEAVHAYKNDVTWWPSRNFEKWYIRPQQDDRKEELPLEGSIRDYLDAEALLAAVAIGRSERQASFSSTSGNI